MISSIGVAGLDNVGIQGYLRMVSDVDVVGLVFVDGDIFISISLISAMFFLSVEYFITPVINKQINKYNKLNPCTSMLRTLYLIIYTDPELLQAFRTVFPYSQS